MDFNNFVLHPTIVDKLNEIDWDGNFQAVSVTTNLSTNFIINENVEIKIKIK